MHTEMGTKDAKSGTKAIRGAKESGAYGSEVEYKQVGVGVVVSSKQQSDEEEDEEEEEESYEEELTEENNPPIPE